LISQHLSPKQRSLLVALSFIAIAVVGAALRLWRISGNYPILPDTALQVEGARAALHGHLPYTYLDLPGPGLAMAPIMLIWGYDFAAAQVAIALYGCVLIGLSYVLGRLLFPERAAVALIFAALVALNPALIASSRIGFMESIQLSGILLFLVCVCAYVRFAKLYALWGSFAVAAALLVLKEPNGIVIGVVYGALGCWYLVRDARARAISRDLIHLLAGGAFVLLPVTVAITAAWQDDRMGRASSGFGLSYLSRNSGAAWDFFRSPIDSPTTGYFIYDHAIGFHAADLFPILVAWVFVVAGAVVLMWRKDLVCGVAIVALVLYGAFYLFFSEWFSRFSLTFLIAQLLLIAVGADAIAGAAARRVRLSAVLVPAVLVPVVALGLVHTGQMLGDWNEEPSYVDNGILVRPADIEELELELYQRPNAYVITTQAALVRMLDKHHRDDVLDLWKFGVRRNNSLEAPTELRAAIEERVAAGQDVLYVPGILDIENGRGQQPRGWGIYYDMIVTDMRAELLHASRNFVSQKFNRARPTFMIYLIERRAPETARP
jgi:hypothetical protein